MSLIEKEKLPYEQIVSESNIPVLYAHEFQMFVEGVADEFTAYFPLVDRIGAAQQEYFLALVGAERPEEAVHTDGNPNFLYTECGRVCLEETFDSIEGDVTGVRYLGHTV